MYLININNIYRNKIKILLTKINRNRGIFYSSIYRRRIWLVNFFEQISSAMVSNETVILIDDYLKESNQNSI